ncbi:class I SAM-dependent methyltransferase [Stigmatella aurantiaca]|uniref:Methyltransferase type 11 n=1 Tax=Stigmatella aurantiaca (strain DW4/3-1) TaxID=378806 RepID=Q09D71_STIAD|nr:class I SAM-dependent methyltransferase [Stigmatella aurantiaca]ADO67835.1 Methyltransferase type 11 [Stigmatella aurantiaca DW4/3-1]EAU69676.1 methyltransferase, UbiE/COQ5 family [Stigmatella aurantiaca DW4/3-1]
MPPVHAPPYARVILEHLRGGDFDLSQLFGRHIHWGWWERAQDGDGTLPDFEAAAERMCHRLFEAGGLRDGMSVLDAGCGFGGTTAALDARFQGVSLTGLNIDARQLERAREQVRPSPGNTVAFVEGDACAMPFPDASFDAVLAVECIFHFPDRQRFFEEARRVLRPGGRLVVSDFVPRRAFAPVLGAQDLLFGAYQRRISGFVDIRYPLERYRALAQRTGFTPLAERDITANTLPTYTVVRRLMPRKFGTQAALSMTGLLTLELVTRLDLLRYMILSFSRC